MNFLIINSYKLAGVTTGTSGSTGTKFSTVKVGVRGRPARVPTLAPPLPRDPRDVTYIPGESQTPAARPQLSNRVFPRRNQPAGLTSVGAARRPNSAAQVQPLPGGTENRGGAAERAGGQRAWVLTDQPDSEHQLCIGRQDRSHLPPLPWSAPQVPPLHLATPTPQFRPFRPTDPILQVPPLHLATPTHQFRPFPEGSISWRGLPSRSPTSLNSVQSRSPTQHFTLGLCSSTLKIESPFTDTLQKRKQIKIIRDLICVGNAVGPKKISIPVRVRDINWIK